MEKHKLEFVKLGEIGIFQSGGTPSKSHPEYFNGSIPWITTTALNGGYIGTESANEFITEEGLANSSTKVVFPYSIMVGTRVGVGKVAINTVPMCTNQDIISIVNIDSERWNHNYLRYVITSAAPSLNAQARGATIKGIKLEVLQEINIPNIPLIQQLESVKTLDLIQKMISKRKAQVEELDTLIKARFVEMFGDCKTNPKQWKTLRLDEVADVGSSKRVFVEDLKNEGVPFYRGTEVGALAEGKSITPELFITQDHYKELCEATGAPQVGDLLMPSICPDGRIWVVNTDMPFYFKDGRVLWVHNIRSTLNPVFLLYTLRDRIMTDYLSIASGTTFAELKIFSLKACQVFDVPIDLQNKFADFIAQIDKSKAAIQKSLDELQTLFDSLMQEYFG